MALFLFSKGWELSTLLEFESIRRKWGAEKGSNSPHQRCFWKTRAAVEAWLANLRAKSYHHRSPRHRTEFWSAKCDGGVRRTISNEIPTSNTSNTAFHPAIPLLWVPLFSRCPLHPWVALLLPQLFAEAVGLGEVLAASSSLPRGDEAVHSALIEKRCRVEVCRVIRGARV